MAFKLNNAPFRKKESATHKHPHPTKDEKTVAKGEGTKSGVANNLLDVLSEYGPDNNFQSSREFGENREERQYYEGQVKSRPGWEDTMGTSLDVAVKNARKTDDQGVETGAGKSSRDVIVQSTDADDYFSKNRTQAEQDAVDSAEARDKARDKGGSNAVNYAIATEAKRRNEKNENAKDAQARIDAATEEEKVANMSRKERREHDRKKAATDSAMPKSGFRMQRKGYKH